jgi:dUTP pyrophosphatase
MPQAKISIPVKRVLGSDDLPLPSYQTEDAVGMDLRAAVDCPVIVQPGKIVPVPCGFAMAIPSGFEGQVRSRSGLAMKHGVVVANSPGAIDPDYRGEVLVLLLNTGTSPYEVTRGMRIAQLVIAPVQLAQWNEVAELTATARNLGGFGHTG